MKKYLVITILNEIIAVLLFTCAMLGQNWVSLHGPSRRDTITSLAIGRIGGATRIYAATEKHLFQSTNGGLTWAPTNFAISSPTVVTCDPANSDTVIAAQPNNIYSSVDGMNTAINPMHNTALVPIRLAFSPCRGSHLVFLGTDTSGTKKNPTASSLYKSADGGQTWSAVAYFKDSVHTNIRDILYHPYNINVLWVCGTTPAPPYIIGNGGDYSTDVDTAAKKTNGVWKSTDAGDTWTRQTTGLLQNAPNVMSLAFSKSSSTDTMIVAVLRKDKNPPSVYFRRFTDASWNFSNTMPSGVVDVRAMKISVNHPDTIVAATDDGLVVSTDRTGSWILRNSGLTDMNLRDVIFDPSNNTCIYAATAQSIYKSTNLGETWTKLTMDSTNIIPTSIDVMGGILYTVSKTSPVVSKYSAGSWDDGTFLSSSRFEGKNISINPTNPYFIYACGDSATHNGTGRTDAKIYVSTDNGATWTKSFSNPDISASSTFNQIIANPRTGSPWVYAIGKLSTFTGTKNYYYSADMGVTWSRDQGGMVRFDTVQLKCLAIDISGSPLPDSQVFYAGMPQYGIYKTTNAGSSWSGPIMSGNGILTITLNQQSPSIVYIGGYQGIYKSTNGGLNFGAVFRTDTVPKIIMDHQYPASTNDLYFIGHNGNNIYHTTDGCQSWVDITGSLPTPIHDIQQDP
ncbi:MAG: WD40/YVTN/BNR-like repeat-containing protein [Bacteroidota bacterium]